MAIIAILAALLVPALSRAKENAKSVKCKSNLRQISLAMQLYVGDHGFYPLLGSAQSDFQPSGNKWNRDLIQYVAQQWTNDLFRCPSYRQDQFEGRVEGNTIYLSLGSYGYNIGSADTNGVPQFGIAGDFVGPTSINQNPTRENEVRSPESLIAIGDAFSTLSQNKRIIFIGLEALSRKLPFDETLFEFFADTGIKQATRRHRGSLNIASADAHVESAPDQKLLLSLDEKWLRRWHRDNEPHTDLFTQ